MTPDCVHMPVAVPAFASTSASLSLCNQGGAGVWYSFAEPQVINGPLAAFPCTGDGDDEPTDSRLPTVTVVPSEGFLPAFGRVDVTATFAAPGVADVIAGEFDVDALCRLSYSDTQSGAVDPGGVQCVTVRVKGVVEVARVVVEELELDVGLSAVDKSVGAFVCLVKMGAGGACAVKLFFVRVGVGRSWPVLTVRLRRWIVEWFVCGCV